MGRASVQAGRELELFVQLTRAAERVAVELQPALGRAGLTPGQLGVLEAVQQGPMSLRELGARLFRSGPNMTIVVDNLERDGLVQRARSETDRRIVFVGITPEGRRRFRRTYPTYAKVIAGFMEALAPAEQEQLGRLCGKLRAGQHPK